MAAEPFNSLGGYTVGIPPVAVIDANGNVVTNIFTSGNVAAGNIYADFYHYANGDPLSISAAGSNTQIQYNSNGVFGASANFTFNSVTNLLTTTNLNVPGLTNLGNVSNVTILGGVNGYFLQTDGNGVLSWAAGGGGGGNGSPGGANTQIQFNDAGLFGGSPQFTFNKTSNTLNVTNVTTTGLVNLGSVSNITVTGGNSGYVLSTDGTGNLSWIAGGGGGNGIPGGSNTEVQFNDAGSFGGNAAFTFNDATGILSVPTIRATTLANITGNLRVSGNANFSGAANINLGTVSNVKITGGVNGYVLTTDGAGNLSWSAGGGGGNGSPGGTNTQVQFNSSGTFGASPYLTFNDVTNTLNVAGNLIANTFTIGSGVFQFCRSNVYFATTVTTSNTALITFDANTFSSLDFTIIATNNTLGYRQVSKLSAVLYQSTLHYNEYSTLNINGYVGNFSVGYNAGNIITPASATLYVVPASASSTVYKIMITLYEP